MNRPETAPYDTESKLRMLADGFSVAFLALAEAGGANPSTISDMARIGTALTSTLAELRQLGKANQRAVDSIPLEAVIARLKALDYDERRHVVRAIMGSDGEGKVL